MINVKAPEGAILSAGFVVVGFWEGAFRDKALGNWGSGQIELVDELTWWAEPMASLVETMMAEGREPPGVFDYEVTQEIGAFFCKTLANGGDPSRQDIWNHMRIHNEKFWMQGESDPSQRVIINEVFDAVRHLYSTNPLPRLGKGLVFTDGDLNTLRQIANRLESGKATLDWLREFIGNIEKANGLPSAEAVYGVPVTEFKVPVAKVLYDVPAKPSQTAYAALPPPNSTRRNYMASAGWCDRLKWLLMDAPVGVHMVVRLKGSVDPVYGTFTGVEGPDVLVLRCKEDLANDRSIRMERRTPADCIASITYTVE